MNTLPTLLPIGKCDLTRLDSKCEFVLKLMNCGVEILKDRATSATSLRDYYLLRYVYNHWYEPSLKIQDEIRQYVSEEERQKMEEFKSIFQAHKTLIDAKIKNMTK